MNKRLLKRIIGVVACAVIVVGAVDFALNRLFYNPYRDLETNAKTFALTVQAMIPSAAFAYVMPYSPGTPRNFSVFSQEFSIHQDSMSTDINSNYLLRGTFHYSFGNITPTYTHKKEEPLVYRQSDFTEAAGLSLDTIEDTSYYTAFFGFSSPKTTETLMDSYRTLFEMVPDASCIRLMAKTSDASDAVALGTGGNGAFILLGEGGYRPTYSRPDLYFYEDLQYLAQHHKEASVFLKSGLFDVADGAAEASVDFRERFSYIEAHGIQWIGFVVFAKGSVLKTLSADPALNCIRLTMDTPVSETTSPFGTLTA